MNRSAETKYKESMEEEEGLPIGWGMGFVSQLDVAPGARGKGKKPAVMVWQLEWVNLKVEAGPRFSDNVFFIRMPKLVSFSTFHFPDNGTADCGEPTGANGANGANGPGPGAWSDQTAPGRRTRWNLRTSLDSAARIGCFTVQQRLMRTPKGHLDHGLWIASVFSPCWVSLLLLEKGEY